MNQVKKDTKTGMTLVILHTKKAPAGAFRHTRTMLSDQIIILPAQLFQLISYLLFTQLFQLILF